MYHPVTLFFSCMARRWAGSWPPWSSNEAPTLQVDSFDLVPCVSAPPSTRCAGAAVGSERQCGKQSPHLPPHSHLRLQWSSYRFSTASSQGAFRNVLLSASFILYMESVVNADSSWTTYAFPSPYLLVLRLLPSSRNLIVFSATSVTTDRIISSAIDLAIASFFIWLECSFPLPFRSSLRFYHTSSLILSPFILNFSVFPRSEIGIYGNIWDLLGVKYGHANVKIGTTHSGWWIPFLVQERERESLFSPYIS